MVLLLITFARISSRTAARQLAAETLKKFLEFGIFGFGDALNDVSTRQQFATSPAKNLQNKVRNAGLDFVKLKTPRRPHGSQARKLRCRYHRMPW